MTNMDYLFAFLIVSLWKCFIKEMALGDLLLSVEILRIVKGVSLARWHLLYFFLPSTIVYLHTFQPIYWSFLYLYSGALFLWEQTANWGFSNQFLCPATQGRWQQGKVVFARKKRFYVPNYPLYLRSMSGEWRSCLLWASRRRRVHARATVVNALRRCVNDSVKGNLSAEAYVGRRSWSLNDSVKGNLSAEAHVGRRSWN